MLSCIYRLHQRNLSFGAGVIAQILKGSDSEKVKRFDLSTLSTYGIMKDSTQVYIRRLIAFLEADDYITQTSHGDFSVLTLTRRSAEILMDKRLLQYAFQRKSQRAKRSQRSAGTKLRHLTRSFSDGSELCGADWRHRRVCLHISFLQTLHCVICV